MDEALLFNAPEDPEDAVEAGGETSDPTDALPGYDGTDEEREVPELPDDDRAEAAGGMSAGGAETDRFTLRHLDEIRTVGRDEVVALAQKGLDYDRIRSRLDQSQEAAELIRLLAGQQQLTPEEFADRSRAELLQQQGLSEQAAFERVAQEREQRKAAREQAGREQQEAERQSELRRFLAEYPGVAPEQIAPEVWQDVHGGLSLTNAYMRWENRTLRKELEQLRQDGENRARSAGSCADSGAGAAGGYLADWYGND